MIVSDRRLWLTRDGRVVEDKDPKAAILFTIPGTPVRASEAERYKLTLEDGKITLPSVASSETARDPVLVSDDVLEVSIKEKKDKKDKDKKGKK